MMAAEPRLEALAPSPQPAGDMRFDWSPLSPAEWRALLARAGRSNLLQSFAYGRAVRATRQLMPRFGRIKLGGETIGCLQIQEARLLGLHVVVLDRGPLWFEDKVPVLWWKAFIDLFAQDFPRRLGRFRRFMPELADTPMSAKLVEQAGFIRARSDMGGHRSLWLDLLQDEAKLIGDQKTSFRGALRQAEGQALSVDLDTRGRQLLWFLATYAADKDERRYPRPSPRFLKVLAQAAFAEGQGYLIRALKNHVPIAGVLLVGHGAAATYVAGWSGPAGRAANAHHLLLWRAQQHLKTEGYVALDLGGINPEQAEGVTRFKAAMGGTPYQILPHYR